MGEAIPHVPAPAPKQHHKWHHYPAHIRRNDAIDAASPVETVPHNPLKSFRSTVASTLPRRFDGSLQACENVASTVLDGPLSGNPRACTPIAPKRARAIARPRGRSPPKSKRSS